MVSTSDWIRGVNIGGWLVLERFITPYLFAITDCHVRGEFCYYPGQIDAPPDHNNYCDLYNKCKPHRFESVTGVVDYPVDEYTLLQSFETPDIARRYLDLHYEHFVTRQDVALLKQHGVTHVRVPLGHWILGSVANRNPDDANGNDSSDTSSSNPHSDADQDQSQSPYVQAHGWLYLIRFVNWCREEGIQVWPDLHTAPGSQNGFDNSGQLLASATSPPTCVHWSGNATLVQQTLDTVLAIAQQIKVDGMEDVITGMGILNEPFGDCDRDVVREYNNKALQGIRKILGNQTAVYMGDMFNATKWNDGSWWVNEDHTFLDSHYYHVFAEEPRALSPRQHIAYVCRKNYRDTVSCCYDDAPNNTIPASTNHGISRIIGEWSASFDTLVVAKLDSVMTSIADHQVALEMDRVISPERMDFLKNFVQAQMVTYEAAKPTVMTGTNEEVEQQSVSRGWFYWTLKMEGGAFAEWDFLRGLREGWIPSIPLNATVASVDLYGTCEDILRRTKDDMSIVQIFPDPSTLPVHETKKNWQGVVIDDDLVVSHGESLNTGHEEDDTPTTNVVDSTESKAASNKDSKDRTGGTDSNTISIKPAEIMTPTKSVPSTTNETVDAKSNKHQNGIYFWFPLIALAFFVYAIKMVFFPNSLFPTNSMTAKERREYEPIGSPPGSDLQLTV